MGRGMGRGRECARLGGNERGMGHGVIVGADAAMSHAVARWVRGGDQDSGVSLADREDGIQRWDADFHLAVGLAPVCSSVAR